MKKFSVKTVVAIAIGAALFFVLGRFVAIPSPIQSVDICIQYGWLAFMATVFGPVAGLLIGFIGHLLIDGFGGWYSWIIASAIFGLIMGLITKEVNLEDGVVAKKDLVLFAVGTIIAHLIAWVGVAPVLDIILYGEPAGKVFAQGLLVCASNIVTTLMLGLILCFGYATTKPKKSSTSGENGH